MQYMKLPLGRCAEYRFCGIDPQSDSSLTCDVTDFALKMSVSPVSPSTSV